MRRDFVILGNSSSENTVVVVKVDDISEIGIQHLVQDGAGSLRLIGLPLVIRHAVSQSSDTRTSSYT